MPTLATARGNAGELLAPPPNGSNDTDTLLTLLDQAAAGGPVYGGTVRLRGNTGRAYLTDLPLPIPTGVRFAGDGPSATNITALPAFAGDAMILNADTSGAQEFAWVEDLTLNGNNVAPSCLIFDRLYVNSGITRVICTRASGDGLVLKASSASAGPLFTQDVWAIDNGNDNVVLSGDLRTMWLRNLTSEHCGNGRALVRCTGGQSALRVDGLHLEHYEAGETVQGLVLDGVTAAEVTGLLATGVAGAFSALVTISGASRGVDLAKVQGDAAACTLLVNDITNGRTVAPGAAGYLARYSTDDAVGPGAPASLYQPAARLRAGAWFGIPTGPPGTSTPAANELIASPITLGRTTLTGIGIEVTVLAVGATIRLGIYADGVGGPGALVLDAGTVDASTIGFKSIAINTTLAAGRYWLVAQSVGGTPTVRVIGNSAPVQGVGYTAAANTSQFSPAGYRGAGGAVPLPANFPAIVDASANAPRVLLGT